jgi:hypothetical protein
MLAVEFFPTKTKGKDSPRRRREPRNQETRKFSPRRHKDTKRMDILVARRARQKLSLCSLASSCLRGEIFLVLCASVVNLSSAHRVRNVGVRTVAGM